MIKLSSAKSALKEVLGNLVKLLRFALKTDRFLAGGYFMSAGVMAFFPIITSYFYKLIIDRSIENQGTIPTLPIILILTLGGYYVVNVTNNFIRWGLLNTYFDYLLRYKLQNSINFEFYKKVSSLDIEHLENPKTQDLIQKAKDTMTWRIPDFLRQFSYMFNSSISYLTAFVLLVPYGVFIPIVLTISSLPRFIARTRFGRIVWSIYGAETPKARKMWYLGWLLSNKTAILESRIFQSTSDLLSRFKNLQERLYEENKKPVKQFVKIIALPEVLEVGLTFAIAIWKLPEVTTGAMSVGDFTFFISLLSRLVDGSVGAVLEFGEMYADNLYVNHYFEVMKLKRLISRPENGVKIASYTSPPEIEFKNVFFRYPDSKKLVLKGISFTISPGENVALVGANGAGKTTIVKLLSRFYDVSSGEILINGESIKNIDLDDWHRHLGTLFQEFIQYDMTVKENIMLGNTNVFDEKRMLDAAKKSGASEFIKDLKQGYDQLLGRQFEGGAELSIGQWQKLAIARAFYENAPILILDEPTSAIDAEAEYKIFKNLHKEYKDKSLILISHRFSTVRNADKIIVLKKGEIIEKGNHDDLLASGNLYAEMFGKQAIGYQ